MKQLTLRSNFLLVVKSLPFLLFLIFIAQSYVFAETSTAAPNYLRTVNQIKGKMVRELKINISDKTLIKHLKGYFHPDNHPLVPNRIRLSIELLYLTGRFSKITVSYENLGSNAIRLIYNIEPVKRLHEVVFKGHKRFSSWTLSDIVQLRPGDPLDQNVLNETRDRLLNRYSAEGYVNCSINYIFTNYKSNRIILLIKINEGKARKASSISFPDLTNDLKSKLKTRITVKKGRVLSLTALKDDKIKIQNYLKNHYYPLASVFDPLISNDNHITWRVQPGPRAQFIFRSSDPFKINLFSNTSYDLASLLIDLNLNQYFDINQMTLKKIKNTILAFFQSKGFLDVSVRIDEKFNKIQKLKQYIFIINKGKRYKFKINIVGNKKIESRKLISVIKNSSNKLMADIFNEKDLVSAYNVFVNYYKSMGFLNAKIIDEPIYTFNRRKAFVTVVINVDEGQQSLIRSITIKGIPGTDRNTILQLSNIKEGKEINPFEIEALLGTIETFYKEKGYYYVKILSDDVIKYSKKDNFADIHIDISLGSITRVGEVIFHGNYITKNRIIQREINSHVLNLTRGVLYTPSLLQQTQEKLSALGVFQSVNIAPLIKPEDPTTIDVLIKVIERDPGYIKFRIGYKNESGVRASTSITNNNLWGMNRTAYLRAELNQKISDETIKHKLNTEYLIQSGFIEPWLFNSRARIFQHLKMNSNILWERRDRKSFRSRRNNISLSLDKQLSKYGHLQLAHQYEKNIGYNKAEFKDFSDIYALILPVLSIDHRNNTFNPSKGFLTRISIEYSFPTVKSGFNYIKAHTRTDFFVPIYKSFVLAASIRGGTSKTYSEDDSGEKHLPIVKRYFLGGGATVRGYSQDLLGPRIISYDEDGEKEIIPLGGEHFVNYKLELRKPFTKFFSLVTFVDGGNVYLKNHPYTMRHSWGFGLSYQTPIGPIRFEYGFKINAFDDDDSRGTLHFSIGSF